MPATERQYHIALGPGEVAEYVLLPGDPDRVAKIATRFDSIELQRQHREFASVTGQYRGLRMTAISTGIGADNVEIVMAEILAVTPHPTFIRIGSCGVLKDDIALGDLVISSGAVRLEATTKYFVHEGYPAVADYVGGRRARRGGQPARPSRPCRHYRDRAWVLRGSGQANSAAAHSVSRPRR